MKWFHNWRLRRAREKHAYWKARYEILSQMGMRDFNLWYLWQEHCEKRSEIAGKMALYEERVETLLRE